MSLPDMSEVTARLGPAKGPTRHPVDLVPPHTNHPAHGPAGLRRCARLIPVTRTEARYPAALPGMPHGKAAQVLAAVPEGFHPAPTRRQGGAAWLAALTDSPEFRQLRKDRQANVRALAEFLAVARRYEYGILRPGLIALRTALPDVCRETVYRLLRWLREHHWLGHVQRGSTERYRAQADGRGDLAAEFVALLPHRPPPSHGPASPDKSDRSKNATPNRPVPQDRRNSLRTRTRPHHQPNNPPPRPKSTASLEPLRGHPTSKPATAGNNGPEEGRRRGPAWPVRQVPATQGERLTAAQALQAELPDLRAISDRAVRSLLRPWYVAGWSNYDIHHALDHTPGGASHRYGGGAHRIRYLAGWTRSRLALWLAVDQAGTTTDQPGDSPTVRRHHQADHERRTARPVTADLGPPPTVASAATRTAALASLAAVLAATNQRTRPVNDPPTTNRTPKAWR